MRTEEEYQRTLDKLVDERNDALNNCYEMKAENEALRKDAERYRWLRNSDVGPAQIWELLSDDCTPPIMTLKCIHYLDEAIDSAMKGEGKC